MEPPSEAVWRYRFRILKQFINLESEPFVFVLEHYYSPQDKLMCFFVRSIHRDVRKKYRVSILNRKNEENKICFEGITNGFEDFGHISNFMKEDMTKVFVVTYSQLQEFCFFCEEDNTTYFSLHVQFI